MPNNTHLSAIGQIVILHATQVANEAREPCKSTRSPGRRIICVFRQSLECQSFARLGVVQIRALLRNWLGGPEFWPARRLN